MKLWKQIFGARTAPPLRLVSLDSAAAVDVSRLHAGGGFARGWSVAECEALLADRAIVANGAMLANGRIEAAVLSRIAADEAEMLIIVVAPSLRQTGIGSRLMLSHAEGLVRQGARKLFLEVDENNRAARALYAGSGFVTAGSRAGYYPLPDGTRATALILRRELE